MDQKPMLVVAKHTISLSPQAVDLLLAYIQYFVRSRQAVLDPYHQDREGATDQAHESVAGDAQTVATIQSEIERAEALVHDVEQLKQELNQIYKLNFAIFADVFRNT
ncbi:MAG TPA: hypothetical protein VLA19_23345, partial [Herpetosiphonaceae bacterium]|nr:hypothetical protein [Herpetosiphonaceae bacterium]